MTERAHEACAAESLTEQEQRIKALEHEAYILRTAGIVEIAARNPSVFEYVEHWEGRALKAEAAVERLATDEMCAVADRTIGMPIVELNNAYDREKQARRAAEARAEAAEARIAMAEAVVKPFAEKARLNDENPHTHMLGDGTPLYGHPEKHAYPDDITLGHLRAARSFLGEPKGGGDD